MTAETQPDEIRELLSRMEQNLETPVIPGELAGWLKDLRRTYGEVERLLTGQWQRQHEQQLRQIREQDTELLPRVEHLQEEDTRVRAAFQELDGSIGEMEQIEGQPELDRGAVEQKLQSKLERLVRQGLAFVLRARTLETELATWHMEAFQRDRGVAD